jgi:rhamnogalacturonan endolyase
MEWKDATRCRAGLVFTPFLYAVCVGMLIPACDSSGTGGKQTGGTTSPGTIGAGGQTQTGGSTTATSAATTPTGGSTTATSAATTPTGGSTTATSMVTSPAGGSTTATSAVTTPTGGGTTPSGGVAGRGGSRGGGTTSAGGVTTVGGTTAAGGATPTGGNTAVTSGTGHYQMENLDRGVVAVVVSGGVYVGWRMFGYEYDTTASNVSYNLYKGGTKLANVTDSTNYLDAAGSASSSYTVSAVIKGVEGAQSAAVTPWAQNYTSIPLTPPSGSYSANDGATGDLDGDGKLDIVLKWDPSNSHDNAQSGVTSDVYIDGYTLAGKRLWRIDLGPNIRAGAHYTQMSVADFDGDGKAELAVKTAPGTKDGTGAYLSTGPAASDDDSAVYRNTDGYILTGPEYVTVFAGDTGKELATVDYPVPRGNVGDWGDTYGNRVDRFNGGIAFVKEGGVATGRPSIIQGRGYYTRLTVSSLTFRAGVLAKNWVYDSVTACPNGGGDHSEMAADTDNDGGQEVITGARTIDSAGTLKCDAQTGHGDAMHISELVVGKGISVFSVHESLGGGDCHDGATCKTYFNVTGGGDNGRGAADYVGVGDETAASCSSSHTGNLNCGTGATVTPNAGSNFLIYWDDDEWRELESGTSITKASGGTLLSCSECGSNNSTKATPTLTADLLGDWREELVLRESSNAALRVFTTTTVTKRRIYTLMHDPTYRAQVAFENSAYNQPPHVGFHIGVGMADPPKPDIFVVK